MNLQQLIDQAPEGGTVVVPSGTHLGALVIEKSITLRGEKKASIDAERNGACILINHPAAKVTLQHLTLRNGSSPVGGGIAFRVGEELIVEDCLVEDGASVEHGGGGALLAGRKARLVRVRFERNTGQQGGAVMVDQECDAELLACVLAENIGRMGSGLRVKEGARVRLVHCTLTQNASGADTDAGDEIVIGGTMSRTPTLEVVNSVLSPRSTRSLPVRAAGQYEGKVSVHHSLVPEVARGQSYLGVGVIFGVPEFMPSGVHRQKLAHGSAALGAGDPKSSPSGLKDLAGQTFNQGGLVDLGAYAASGGGLL